MDKITVTATNGNIKNFTNVEGFEWWSEEGIFRLWKHDDEEPAEYIGEHVAKLALET